MPIADARRSDVEDDPLRFEDHLASESPGLGGSARA